MNGIKRLFSLLVVLMLVFSTLAIVSSNAFSDNDDHSESLLSKLKRNTDNLNCISEYSDIRDFLNEYDEVARLIQDSNIMLSLCELIDVSDKNCDDSAILTLMSYIESGYSLYDISTLSNTLTPITLRPTCGKTIPGYVYSGPETALAYNCHSYAWYYGSSFNPNDRMKIYQPQPYFSTAPSCYTAKYVAKPLSQISLTNNDAGCVILFYLYSDESNTSGSSTLLAHSAILHHISNGVLYIKEKNGSDPENTTPIPITQSPFYYATGGSHHGQGRLLSVYKPSHTIDSAWRANQYYKFRDANSHYIACPMCGRGTTGAYEAHTYVTVGAVTRCTKCGIRVESRNSPNESTN